MTKKTILCNINPNGVVAPAFVNMVIKEPKNRCVATYVSGFAIKIKITVAKNAYLRDK